MLFNSYTFIFVFLPIVLGGFAVAGWAGRRAGPRWKHVLGGGWLVGASLVFYGWWEWDLLWLIGFSVGFNYVCGVLISGCRGERTRFGRAWWLTCVGVAVNLGLLGYFKYADFFVRTVSAVLGEDVFGGTVRVALPLAISFFTFQQIAYLVDAFKRETEEHSFLDYCLFVTFFPQLIAGPIVHHGEMLPQFRKRRAFRLDATNMSVGLTMFSFGLFKKVMIADALALHANPVFDRVLAGGEVSFGEAWVGALAYTFVIYFDFSGYSDMAIGLGRMFNIRLPVNFCSPYKATSIIEFWRRWHVTLSRFLRDYLYIPLGGSRKGRGRRYVNLMVTMLLGGLWHGSAWVFVIWGGLHGLYLVVNHATRALRGKSGSVDRIVGSVVGRFAGWAVTFVAVVVAWVFFRAGSSQHVARDDRAMLAGAWEMLGAMFGAEGVDVGAVVGEKRMLWEVGVAMLVACVMPNTQQMLRRFRPVHGLGPWDDELAVRGVLGRWLTWRMGGLAGVAWAVIAAAALVVSVMHLTRVSDFIYWQF